MRAVTIGDVRRAFLPGLVATFRSTLREVRSSSAIMAGTAINFLILSPFDFRVGSGSSSQCSPRCRRRGRIGPFGFTVLAGAFSVGNISGGAFNPAVAIGISVMGLSVWPNIWIYLLANFAGAAIAAGAFKALNAAEREDVYRPLPVNEKQKRTQVA